MKIKLGDIRIFYLTTEKRVDRDNHMKSLLEGCKHVRRIIGPSQKNVVKDTLGSLGHCQIIQEAILESWEPFLLLEDDCALFHKEHKEEEEKKVKDIEIEVPDDADMLFLGISKCGNQPQKNMYCFDLLAEKYAQWKGIRRVYNMLSTHAMLFLSRRYMLAYMQAMMECATVARLTKEPTAWDCIASRIYPYFFVYALKTPIFYQTSALGGQEEPTRVHFPKKMKKSNEKEAQLYHSLYNHLHGVTFLLYEKVTQ